MKNLYLRFVALSCIPLNIVLLIVMSLYAKYKWDAPLKASLHMWYHSQMRSFWFAFGNAKKEKYHMDSLMNAAAEFMKEKGLA